MATKLEKLLIGEVSGVDAPAHGAPGWLIQKARDGSLPQGLSVSEIGDGGFYVVAEDSDFHQTLRARGEEAVTAHFTQILNSFHQPTTGPDFDLPDDLLADLAKLSDSDLAKVAAEYDRLRAEGN